MTRVEIAHDAVAIKFLGTLLRVEPITIRVGVGKGRFVGQETPAWICELDEALDYPGFLTEAIAKKLDPSTSIAALVPKEGATIFDGLSRMYSLTKNRASNELYYSPYADVTVRIII